MESKLGKKKLIRKKRQDIEESLEITKQNDSRQEESSKGHISDVGIRRVRMHTYRLCDNWTFTISTHVSDLFHSNE
jgi:hypothetical protein